MSCSSRYPRAFLGHCYPGRRLALAFGNGRAFLGCRSPLGPLAHRGPGKPGDPEHQRDEHKIPRSVRRVVEDDDRGCTEHDREPGSRLELVT
jgi:hypothetical protein